MSTWIHGLELNQNAGVNYKRRIRKFNSILNTGNFNVLQYE